MSIETFQMNVIGQFLGVLLPNSRIYYLYLISAIILAFVAYIQVEALHRHEDEEAGVPKRKGFLQFVFDPSILFHRSTKQDLVYFAVNSLVYYGLISQFLISSHALIGLFNGFLIASFGELQAPLITSWQATVAYTLVAILAMDFGVFLTHYAMHKIPILWHFHKVHHSAEVLNPMTLFRMHPVDLFLTSVVVAFFTGISVGGLFYLAGQQPEMLTIFGINIVLFLFYLAGYNLRHSHIWLNYPVWLSRIFVSPAQHQIHHSSDPKHFDRNMGLIFSFWDQLFKTIYIPRGYEKLEYGLSRDDPNPFKSITDIYVKPFQWAGQTLRSSIADRQRRAFVYCGIAAVTAGYLGVFSMYATPQSELQSHRLEQMTWIEVHHAIEDGYRTAIIPTGGTEQNGPFVALGKHNWIVAETADQIAEKIGNTLVAPVMAYVPEGDIDPPSGHMLHAGTLSLPEPVFEAVLEATVRSLATHGFKRIFILGDSGQSQAAQERAAKRMDENLKERGVRVANVGDYYSANGQAEWLAGQGYTREQIGTHAGMRDMSELIEVEPGMVRIADFDLPSGYNSGSNGDFQSASETIGEKMIDLKVAAAVDQIEQLLEEFGAIKNGGAFAADPHGVDSTSTAATD